MLYDPDEERTADDPDLSAGSNWSMSVQCGTDKSHLSGERANSYLTDSKKEQKEMIADQEHENRATADTRVSVSAKENWSMHGQHDTSETYHSTKRGELYLPNSRSQYDTTELNLSAKGYSSFPDMRPHHATTNFSTEGGDSYLPGTCPKYQTAEGSNENEEASEVESPVDRWACRVCKDTMVSILVLPCSHLCLCWNCESETDKCPVCGELKTDVIYVRTE